VTEDIDIHEFRSMNRPTVANAAWLGMAVYEGHYRRAPAMGPEGDGPVVTRIIVARSRAEARSILRSFCRKLDAQYVGVPGVAGALVRKGRPK
jgi:hypothetical protein